VEVVTVNRTPSPRTSPMLANSEFTEDAVLVPLPDQGESSSPRSSIEHIGDVDLLSDEDAVLRSTTSTGRLSEREHSEHNNLPSGCSPDELIKSPESGEEEVPPDNTIRLVGGGGTQGKIEDTTREILPEMEEDIDLVEIQPVEVVTSIDSKKAKKGKHKKGGKSSGSVANILGGKRKKSSTSNATPAAS